MRCCAWTAYEEQVARACGGGFGRPALRDALRRSPSPPIPPTISFAAHGPGSRTTLRRSPPLWRGERYRHDRIRLAYLSADFHEHATAYLMAGLFERHDRSRFETIAISSGPDDDSAMRARLHSGVRPLRRRARAEAIARSRRLMRDMEIDIAVDLKGFTGDSRARPSCASRPAPVQVNYLGYPGTMGARLHRLHHRRPDRHSGRRSSAFYSEKIVYLPDSYQANDPKRRIAERDASPREAGLPRDRASSSARSTTATRSRRTSSTSGCGSCATVDGSVLWLLDDNAMRPTANLRREAAGARRRSRPSGVRAARRRSTEHLARHRAGRSVPRHAALQRPHDGERRAVGRTAGVTCLGATFAGRVAASLLMPSGCRELDRALRSLPTRRWRCGSRAIRRARRDQGEARAQPRHLSAVRHRPLSPPYRGGLCGDVGAVAGGRAARELCRRTTRRFILNSGASLDLGAADLDDVGPSRRLVGDEAGEILHRADARARRRAASSRPSSPASRARRWSRG